MRFDVLNLCMVFAPEFREKGGGALEIDARGLGEAAEHAIDVGGDIGPIGYGLGVVDCGVGGARWGVEGRF